MKVIPLKTIPQMATIESEGYALYESVVRRRDSEDIAGFPVITWASSHTDAARTLRLIYGDSCWEVLETEKARVRISPEMYREHLDRE